MYKKFPSLARLLFSVYNKNVFDKWLLAISSGCCEEFSPSAFAVILLFVFFEEDLEELVV